MKDYSYFFIGIPLPEAFQKDYDELLKKLAKIDTNLDLVGSQSPHLTIYFLDKKAKDSLVEIEKKVTKHAPKIKGLKLKVGEMGLFSHADPRVLFLEIEAKDTLWTFHQKMEDEFSIFDAPDNAHWFSPHITLAKMRNEEAQTSFLDHEAEIKQLLAEVNWTFPVEELIIYGVDSTQTPQVQEKLVIIKI